MLSGAHRARSPCPATGARRRTRGLTLVELVVTIALLAMLLGLAAPSFGLWTRNARVRTVTDAMLTGVRLAQAEAVRRNRQVALFLTNSAACTLDERPASNGAYWAIRTVPLTTADDPVMVQCGALAELAGGVAIEGPTTLCFNSLGRPVANNDPGLGGTACTLPASGVSRWNVSALGSDRPLGILVGLAGQARMCDPARTLSASSPDGCPA